MVCHNGTKDLQKADLRIGKIMTDTIQERLQYIFGNVNNWLKYAETKSAALLVINLTSITAATEKIENIENNFLLFYILCFLVFSALSFLTCLISFLPKVKIPKGLLGFFSKNTNTNILYYADLSHLSANQLLGEVKTSLGNSGISHDSFSENLAEQIVCNARIATMKYEFFIIALWFTVSAFLTPLSIALIYSYIKSNGLFKWH